MSKMENYHGRILIIKKYEWVSFKLKAAFILVKALRLRVELQKLKPQ